MQEKVLDRGERKNAKPGILLCAPHTTVFFRIHVWRVPYEACIPLKYGDPIHRLNQQIKQSIPWDQTVCSQPSTAKSQEALAQSAGKNPE